MSAIENLMTEVQDEADRQQPELIRRLAVNYPVGGTVCEFQAVDSKLRKLKRKLRKTDEYVAHLGTRIGFLMKMMDGGNHPNVIEMMSRRHREYTDEELEFLSRAKDLTEEVGRVEVLLQLTVACGRCVACRPRTPVRRIESWRTKRTTATVRKSRPGSART